MVVPTGLQQAQQRLGLVAALVLPVTAFLTPPPRRPRGRARHTTKPQDLTTRAVKLLARLPRAPHSGTRCIPYAVAVPPCLCLALALCAALGKAHAARLCPHLARVVEIGPGRHGKASPFASRATVVVGSPCGHRRTRGGWGLSKQHGRGDDSGKLGTVRGVVRALRPAPRAHHFLRHSLW